MVSLTPKISVVTAVRNGAELLPRAAESVLRQSAADWEWIIVDDGSTDPTPELLENLLKLDSRIRMERLSKHTGLSAARNTALRQANGKLVAYLDHDDEFYLDHFANILEWQNRADVLIFEYDLQEDRTGHPRQGDQIRFKPSVNSDRLATGNIAVPLGIVHQLRLLDVAGYFDERLPISQDNTEDCDLWRRFHAAGARFELVPKVCGCYHIRAGSLSRSLPRTNGK